MNKYAELPIIAPIYSTYHYQGDASAVINDNPSIRNWFLNNNLILIWKPQLFELYLGFLKSAYPVYMEGKSLFR